MKITGKFINTNLYIKLNLFCAIAYITIFTLPFARSFLSGSKYYLALFGLIFLWFLTTLSIKSNWLLVKDTTLYLSIWFIAVFAAFAFFNIGDVREYIFAIFGFYFFYIMYRFYTCTNLNKEMGIIAAFSLFIVFITVITTFRQLQADKTLLRTLASSQVISADRMAIRRSNLGGFDFIYSLALLFPSFIAVWANKDINKTFYKISWILACLFVFLTIIDASFATATIIAFSGGVIGYLSKFKNKYMKIISFIILFILLIMLYSFLPPLIHYVSLNVNNEELSIKLAEVADAFSGQLKQESDFASRMRAIDKSFTTFYKNFFFGVGPYIGKEAVAKKIGEHSQLFDDLARYGFLYFIFYIAFIKSFYKRVNDRWKQFKMKSSFSITIWVLVVFSILNPIPYLPFMGLALFIIAPAIPEMIHTLKLRKI